MEWEKVSESFRVEEEKTRYIEDHPIRSFLCRMFGGHGRFYGGYDFKKRDDGLYDVTTYWLCLRCGLCQRVKKTGRVSETVVGAA